MKIIVTTSDGYLHIVPIFCHLFNTYWSKDQEVEIVGYRKPDIELPSNFTFHSLGEQSGSSKNFGTDLVPYFEKQDRRFIWMMEDTFIKAPVKMNELSATQIYSVLPFVGRVSLTSQNLNQYTEFAGHCETVEKKVLNVSRLPQLSEYRLSTMPAIWKKDFLLQYLVPNMNPWEFECQDKVKDQWDVVGVDRDSAPVEHNEGVRRFDVRKYNFEGMDSKVIEQLKQWI